MARSGLRGPSAEALAALERRVAGAPGAELPRLAEDLFGVAGVLRAEPSLRRVATDLSTEDRAKSGMMQQLFGARIGDPALELVVDAVKRRWTVTRDLADTLEHLGVVALVRSVGDQADRLSDELFGVGRLVEDQAELRSALSDPARSSADKGRLLRNLLGDRVLPATMRLAEQSLSGSYRTPELALEDYQQVAADVHGERVATVRVARELTAGERDRLAHALRHQYDRDVHVNVLVEPDLIGGIRVEIGDDVIDGAVSTKLDEARRKLVG